MRARASGYSSALFAFLGAYILATAHGDLKARLRRSSSSDDADERFRNPLVKSPSLSYVLGSLTFLYGVSAYFHHASGSQLGFKTEQLLFRSVVVFSWLLVAFALIPAIPWSSLLFFFWTSTLFQSGLEAI